METLLADFEFWHWWMLAVVLVIIEILLPGIVFLWLGISATTVGVILLLVPTLSWQMQIIMFAILSVVTVTLWRVYERAHPVVTDEPFLNRRGEMHIGHIYPLETDIVGGYGKAKVGDGHWTVSGPEMTAGTLVKVIGIDGAVLKVCRYEDER